MVDKNSGSEAWPEKTVSIHQWVFGPIGAVTIPASASAIRIRGCSGTYNNLFTARASVRFVQPDGSLRATIISSATALDGVLWDAAYATHDATPTCANVSALDGDYLVIEIGTHKVATAGAEDIAYIKAGDTDAATRMYVTLPATIILGVAPTSLTYTYSSITSLVSQPCIPNSPTVDGIPAPTFAIQSGSLPTNMSLNSTTGIISGTPSAYGVWSCVIRATNSQGYVDSGTLTYTIKSLYQGGMGLSLTMR